MTAVLAQILHRIVALVDRLVPKGRSVVVRTFPDYDDQCRAMGEALDARGVEVVVLVDDDRPPSPPLTFPCRIVPARSLAAAWAFLRSGTVVHTHGVYGNIRGARRRRFVNVWHGMPIKLLPSGSAVGRNQTDITVATSTVHAEHLARTWHLGPDQVAVVGLPRNDRLVTTPRDPSRLASSGIDRPLAIWMPTYRATADGSEVDGVDRGSTTQFAGADLPTVDRLMGDAGFDLIVKPHPLAPVGDHHELEHVRVWSDDDLRAHGWTLYELLAQADLLITDVSSVWIDFLLVDRPIIFAMSDRTEYESGRGTYFDDLDALVPGGICTDLGELRDQVEALGRGEDPFADERAVARALHHEATPGTAAGAVAALVTSDVGTDRRDATARDAGAFRQTAGRVSLGVFDQLLSSTSNFVALLVAARLLETSQVGIYALAYTTYIVALGTCRALCSEALLVRVRSLATEPEPAGTENDAAPDPLASAEAASRSGRAVTDGAALGLVLAPVLLVAAAFGAGARGPFLVLALALPLLLVQDTFRYAALARQRPTLAVGSDLLWLLLQAPAYALVVLIGPRTATTVFLAWAATGAIAGLVQLTVDRVGVRPSLRFGWVRENLDLGGRYVIDFLAGTGVAQVAAYALALITSVTALGALRSAQTIFGPMNVLISGAYIAFVPEAQRLARTSVSALTKLCVAIAVVLAVLAAALAAVLLLLPDAEGRMVLGRSWADARTVILPVGLASMAGGVFAGASTGLRALQGARELLRARVVTVPFTLAIPVIGAWRYGLTGAAYGVAAASWWSLVWWWRAYAQAMRSYASPPPPGDTTSSPDPVEPMAPVAPIDPFEPA